jgi:hypothetical protein
VAVAGVSGAGASRFETAAVARFRPDAGSAPCSHAKQHT